MFKHILAALLAFVAIGSFAAVDINRANQAELEAVKGVGTVTAGKILDERKNGSFKDWSDVMARVGGIKESKAGKLSAAGLTVNGESYHAPAKLNDKPAKGAKGAHGKGSKPSDGKPAK
ncbi:MAG TPA: helix-hairpin-helix domain-containing protein [Albitalea sp.]|nr:helix-hairpin-helix domain-containing protein [Albitalea sp.]